MKLSVVTTLYMSAPYIREFHSRASKACQALTQDYEIIFVNDGSPDHSLISARELQGTDHHVIVVDLSRNYGHHKAIMTGLKVAKGDLVFLIDVDLEEEPELLTRFSAELANHTYADVIYGVQASRKGKWFERLSGEIFYRVFNFLSEIQLPKNFVTARLMTRRYVDSLLEYGDKELYLGGVWALVGFEQKPVVIEKLSTSPSTYTFRKKLRLFVNSLTSFSSKPLEMIFYLGMLITIISFISGIYLILRKLLGLPIQEGWASVMVSIWFLGGVLMFCLGLTGIYISRIYVEVKQRPLVTIRNIYRKGPN